MDRYGRCASAWASVIVWVPVVARVTLNMPVPLVSVESGGSLGAAEEALEPAQTFLDALDGSRV